MCRSAAAMRRCFPGDVMLGDADGVIVIPAAMASDVAEEATRMTVYEDFVVDMVAAEAIPLSGSIP